MRNGSAIPKMKINARKTATAPAAILFVFGFLKLMILFRTAISSLMIVKPFALYHEIRFMLKFRMHPQAVW